MRALSLARAVVALGAIATASPAQARLDRADPAGLAVTPVDLRGGWEDPGVQAIARAIGDARIVMLGEPWHGDGAAIRARAELVRVLHEHLGFDVLALEADFYSLDRGWAALKPGDSVQELVAENVYHFWSRSAAAAPLWTYVESRRHSDRPLHVAGLDIRHVGAVAHATLPDALEARAGTLRDVSPTARARFRALVVQLLEREWNSRPDTTAQASFFAMLDRLEADAVARAGARSFDAQEIRNLRHAARFAWLGANRDRGMGENLAWVASHRHPGRKIIVWAHNNHIITDKWMYYASADTAVRRSTARRTLDQIAASTYLGHEAREYFGPSVFSLAVLSGEGEYTIDVRTENLRQRGNFDSTRTLAPAPPGTIESALASLGHEMAFIDLHASAPGPRAARALDYVVTPPLRMRYETGFDGMLFIRTTFGIDHPPPASWPGIRQESAP